MRVLLVAPRATGIGGVAQHAGKLARLLAGDGHEVRLVSVENTPHVPVKGLYNPSFAVASYLRALAGRLEGERYDVAHAHNFPSWPAASAARADRRIITVHGVFSSQHRELHGSIAGALAGWLEARWAGSADALTCVSRRACEHYSRSARRTVWVPNAVDTEELPDEGITLGDPQVAYVGRLSREKGVDVLAEAARLLPREVTLVIVGSGDVGLIRRALELPNVRYVGYQPHDAALRYIRGSRALVLPSRQEGMPTAALEAMAMGVPVVASDIPELRELSANMAFFRAGDPADLAATVGRVVTEGFPAAEAAREEVVRNYSWRAVYARYLEVYRG
ncbi:MAG: glycosyltransferase family 4 protein [Conexivisphaera sp.]